MAEKLKVYLCKNHFESLVEGRVCEDCPSVPEHKEAVMAMATLNAKSESDVHVALLTEIRSLRRAVQVVSDRVDNVQVAILGDGNGNKGLRSRVMLLEYDRRVNHSYASMGVAVLSVVVAIAAVLVSIFK